MNDAVDTMFGDHTRDQAFVAGIADGKRHALGQDIGKSGGKVVDHCDRLAGVHQRVNHVTSDIAGAAGDKHAHVYSTHLL